MDVLKYWRNSLADADILDPDFGKRKSEAVLVGVNDIEEGRINPHSLKQLLPNVNDKKKTVLEVLLCPAVANLKRTHGSRVSSHLPDEIVPLWIPALLDLSGKLKPHTRLVPWLSRDYLEPCEGEVLSIGSIDQFDIYLSTHSIDTDDWNNYLRYANELFHSVTGMLPRNFTHEQYELTDDCYLLLSDLIVGTSKSIQDLYGYIERDGTISPLLQRFATLDNHHAHLPKGEYETDQLSTRHFGQMSDQFSLSPSQRQAMHHTILLRNGDLLAVNGPPGTGKTTLLQSMVATVLIERAMENLDPPVIVVSSTNNNAVTNVIESFGKINELGQEKNPLSGRWIPDLDSYGAYLKSSFKNEEVKANWLTVLKGKGGANGYFDRFENRDYLIRASQYYLEKCAAYTSEQLKDVGEAVELLHAHLMRKVQQLQKIINLHANYRELERRLDHEYPTGVNNVIQELEKKSQRLSVTLADLENLRQDWRKYQSEEQWWIPLLLRIPLLKSIASRKKQLRCQYFCSTKQLPNLQDEDKIDLWFVEQDSSIKHQKRETDGYLTEAKCKLAEFIGAKKKWDDLEKTLPLRDGETYLEYLDRTYRYETFKLAVHYWEGRWLLETEGMLSNPAYKRNNGRQGQTLLWRRLAKLTPCFVTTLYMLPSFFSAWEGRTFPLYEYIDLLIIDEAGQVVPEAAGASFALAKRSVIVGDTKQIPPVWKVPVAVDIGNLKRNRILTEINPYDSLSNTGILASSGSVMDIARRQTQFTLSESDGGLWLTEHRRCVPQIISYCNELAYHGKLEPKRKPLSDFFLPHMGYAHVPGYSEKRGGSLENKFEAEVIVSWIDRNKDKLLEAYVKDGLTRIEDIVAVITPFAPQKRLLLQKLRSAGLKGIKAGTVHTLQGDERPIVIFSPVYDSNQAGEYFFDKGISMLNVAVSRARDSFLVFGDMGIFSPESSSPSGLLAKYLFASEDNEIRNIELGSYFKTRYGEPVEHLHELEHHRQMLRDCIQSANKEINIISPFLSSVAIEADQLENLFTEAVSRGVVVTVYTDEALNYFRKSLKLNYLKAKELLVRLGVRLLLTRRVHSKALWVDSKVLVEGSFNWLSAVRTPTSQWCRFETSLVYRGSKVPNMISKIRNDLENRVVVPKAEK
ncbi:hypothetical protein GE107_16330 [Cohnella sp. CFH 77786]|uniref:AAA domain-containing protein n=1 Tax=Cohnella sp. CFH 77786 TaxID=2662265 RepID=UPI001C60E72A|nr:AAA domain-containing protein [Cohnella sp. CFH 77786]MBW5447626.1 hypothetical protein [Cohnella sp. CFH 77786]